MFQALKSIALSLALSIPVAAQWGAVTQKDDYNRFINSTSKYGLIMSTQELVKERQDTTITSAGTASGGAHKIIAWDDRQTLYNCTNFDPQKEDPCEGSLEFAQIRESTLSMFQASRGDTALAFPVVGQAEINVGQDSLVVRNSLDGEIHSVYLKGSNGPLGNGNMENLDYKDRNIYVATATQLYRVDPLTDTIMRWGTNTEDRFQGNLQERNDGHSFVRTRTVGIYNQDTNAIAVVRDIFGLLDPLRGFGVAPWWAVNTATGLTVYNPHQQAFYDEGTTGVPFDVIALSSKGELFESHDSGPDLAGIKNSIFSTVTDGWQENAYWRNDQSGGRDLAGSPEFTSVAFMEGRGDRDVSEAYAGNNGGVYRLTHAGLETLIGGDGYVRQQNTNAVNAPPEFGPSEVALAFESNVTDSSPNALSLTTVGTLGYVTSVFGSGASTQDGSYLTATVSAISNGGFSGHFWFKSSSATNPSSSVYLFQAGDSAGNEYFQVYGHTDGTLVVNRHDGSAQDGASTAGDVWDGEWHHIAFRSQILPTAFLEMYVDGVLTGSDGSIGATGAVANDRLHIFNRANSPGVAHNFNGFVDDFWLQEMGAGLPCSLSPEEIARIHSEGRAALNAPDLNLVGQSDDALYRNSVISVDVRDNMNGDWIVAFSDGKTAQVFNGRVLVDTFALSENLKGAAFLPDYGQDSAAVVIYGATKTRMVRPQVSLEELAAFDWQAGAPKVVREHVLLDSSGVGHFWRGNDAVDAGANADKRRIFVMDGTYGPLDLDQSRIYVECESTQATFDGKAADHGIHVTAPRSVIDGCGAKTTAGGGSAYDGIHVAATGDSTKIEGVHIADSDDQAISWLFNANVGWILNSTVDGADDHCVTPDAQQILVSGNQVRGCGGRGIAVDTGFDVHIVNNHLRGITTESINISNSAGDHVIVVGNRTVDGTYGVRLASGSDNNVIVGNRLSGASVSNYTDGGSGNTAAGNNTN